MCYLLELQASLATHISKRVHLHALVFTYVKKLCYSIVSIVTHSNELFIGTASITCHTHQQARAPTRICVYVRYKALLLNSKHCYS